jgi:thiol:disulfide interchange protein DsbD
VSLIRLFAALAIAACVLPALAGPSLKPLGQQDLLSVDEAFQVLPPERRGRTVHVEWNIAPGYFLYRGRLHFDLVDASTGAPLLPKGELHDDENGKVEIYRGILAADLPINGKIKDPLHLKLGYQGCADIGICYPPQTRELTVEPPK